MLVIQCMFSDNNDSDDDDDDDHTKGNPLVAGYIEDVGSDHECSLSKHNCQISLSSDDADDIETLSHPYITKKTRAVCDKNNKLTIESKTVDNDWDEDVNKITFSGQDILLKNEDLDFQQITKVSSLWL